MTSARNAPKYVRLLDCDRRQAEAELTALHNGITQLRTYLTSPKFTTPGDRMGYVNVQDVLLRLDETVHASYQAGDDMYAQVKSELDL